MFLFDVNDIFPFPDPIALVNKDDKCCNFKHYKAIPYVNYSDINLFATSVNPLALVQVTLIMYDVVGLPFTLVPLTAGVDYLYRTGTDPNGGWQLQITATVGLNAHLLPVNCTLFGFFVVYTDNANLTTTISYEFSPTECFCKNWVRICDNKNKWGCVQNYLSIQNRIYYGELDSETGTGFGYAPSHCVVIPSRVNQNSAKSSTGV